MFGEIQLSRETPIDTDIRDFSTENQESFPKSKFCPVFKPYLVTRACHQLVSVLVPKYNGWLRLTRHLGKILISKTEKSQREGGVGKGRER